jgi:hypothetical protein
MDSTLSGLAEVTTPDPDDLLLLVAVSDAEPHKVKASNLISALPVSTSLSKGLQSAADKVALDSAIADVAVLKSPLVATVASASTVVVPASTFQVILTGTTNVTSLAGLANYRTYTFFYPTGAGLTFMGLNMQAGDVYQFTQTP